MDRPPTVPPRGSLHSRSSLLAPVYKLSTVRPSRFEVATAKTLFFHAIFEFYRGSQVRKNV
jgi:hypothetical protein